MSIGEPTIAHTLRNYLSRRGHSFKAVPCHDYHIDQLRHAGLLEERNGRVYFNGQELCKYEEAET